MVRYTLHNQVKLIRGGGEYFEALDNLISTATTSIYFQTYILEEDQTGKAVVDALIKAAQRGVKVFLLLDGYASQNLSHAFIEKIKTAGVFFRWFEPLLRSEKFYFGRRLHHKAVVADAQRCLVGGINICDRYNNVDGNSSWLDWAIYAHGEVALQVFDVCARRAMSRWNGSRKLKFIDHQPANVNEVCRTRMIVNDWVRGKMEISNSYFEIFKKSKKEIIIMSSYFLPGKEFRRKIREAASRKVRVRVVLTQVSDVALAKSAERYLYYWLLKNNVEVYEYTKAVLHGKIAVCDKRWVSIGSYNLNELSAKASVEMNLEVDNEEFGAQVHTTLNRIIQTDCIRITKTDFDNHNHWYEGVWQKMSYIISRVLLFVFTFYFKQTRS